MIESRLIGGTVASKLKVNGFVNVMVKPVWCVAVAGSPTRYQLEADDSLQIKRALYESIWVVPQK